MLLLSNWCPFSPLGRRTCPYPRRWECPIHCGSEARKVLQPWHFSLNFDALGWLHDWPKHIAVAMVSAKCCLSYGECAKLCFPSHKMSKIFWWPFCFQKIWRKYTVKLQKCRVVPSSLHAQDVIDTQVISDDTLIQRPKTHLPHEVITCLLDTVEPFWV